MKKISMRTIEKKVSQASVFYGREDVSSKEFFRWNFSPFLAKILLNIDCSDNLFLKISRDINSTDFNSLENSKVEIEYLIKAVERKAKTFLKIFYFSFSLVIILMSLVISYFNFGNDSNFFEILKYAGSILIGFGIWIVFAVGFISEKIESIYISKSFEYKKLLNYLSGLFVDYKNKIEFWQNLSWQNFELEVAKRFKQFGYNAVNTKLSGDEGVDVLITNNDRKFIVQCKAMKNKVGPSFVRDFIGTVGIQKASGGVMISLSGFSDKSLETSNYQNLFLSI